MRCDALEDCKDPSQPLIKLNAHAFAGERWYDIYHPICCPITKNDEHCDGVHNA